MNMKTIDRQLYEYIDAQEDSQYMTCKGIVIGAMDIDYLRADLTWINTEETVFGISLYILATDFVKLLGIKNMGDIDELAPGMLLELYNEGLAEIFCLVTLEHCYCMSYKKKGNIIVAENDRGFKHNIPAFEPPETQDQYISYTREYYRLIECNEN